MPHYLSQVGIVRKLNKELWVIWTGSVIMSIPYMSTVFDTLTDSSQHLTFTVEFSRFHKDKAALMTQSDCCDFNSLN